jgi:hypothetical protein
MLKTVVVIGGFTARAGGIVKRRKRASASTTDHTPEGRGRRIIRV